MALLTSGDEERIKRYEVILEKEPGAIIFAVLGSLYARKFEFDKAIKALAAGVANYPNYFSARVLLAKCYLAIDNVSAAVDELNGILSLDPYNVPALNTLGDILRSDGKYDEARESYYKILEIEPDNTDTQCKIRLLEQLVAVSRKPAPDVKLKVGEHPAETPEEPQELVTLTLAEVFVEQGLLEKAAAILGRVIQNRPDDENVRAAYNRVRQLIETESKETGDSVISIVGPVPAIKGLTGINELELWPKAERRVVETLRTAGLSFRSLLGIGPEYSTAGEVVLTIDGVAATPDVYEDDLLEIGEAVAELLAVGFELGEAPAYMATSGDDEFVFDGTALRGIPTGEDTVLPTGARRAGPEATETVIAYRTAVTYEVLPGDITAEEPIGETEPGAGRTVGGAGVIETQIASEEPISPEDESFTEERGPEPAGGSVVKPEMYIAEKVKGLDEDPFGDDDDFLGWLVSIKPRGV